MQSFTARMPLLMATRAFGLGRRRWSSPQQCYLHCLRALYEETKKLVYCAAELMSHLQSHCVSCGSQSWWQHRKQVKRKGSPYSITEHRIPQLCSQPTGDVSHKPGGRLPLLSARPAVTLATLKRAGTSFAAW